MIGVAPTQKVVKSSVNAQFALTTRSLESDRATFRLQSENVSGAKALWRLVGNGREDWIPLLRAKSRGAAMSLLASRHTRRK